jgi:hypothetical protein
VHSGVQALVVMEFVGLGLGPRESRAPSGGHLFLESSSIYTLLGGDQVNCSFKLFVGDGSFSLGLNFGKHEVHVCSTVLFAD